MSVLATTEERAQLIVRMLLGDNAAARAQAVAAIERGCAAEEHCDEIERERDRWREAASSVDLVAYANALRERDELLAARRREPSDEGGPGKEETYWLRIKLDAAATHLRDIEDFYRLRGGTPESLNQVRADRARELYEAIISDFREGKLDRPSTREQLGVAHDALRWYERATSYRSDTEESDEGERAREALAAGGQV